MCCQGYHIQMASVIINRDKGFLYHPRSIYNSRNIFNFILSRNMHSNTLYLTTTTSHKSLLLSVDEAKTFIARLSDKEILNLESALDEYSNTMQAEGKLLCYSCRIHVGSLYYVICNYGRISVLFSMFNGRISVLRCNVMYIL